MIYTERPDMERLIIRSLWQPYRQDKPLPHVTELIYCLTRNYWDRRDPLEPTDEEILLWVSGFGLEETLTQRAALESRSPVDGIHYTPDTTLAGYTGEVKSTRMSAKRVIAGDFPDGWIKQIKSYCYCEDITEYLLVCILLMGDYRPPFPKLKVFHLLFTQKELDVNWEWMRMRRDIYLLAFNQSIVPTPKGFNDDWECQHCRYKLRCDTWT